MRQIILDTETTGLSVIDGHRIIEIGCVELINRKITGKHFHQYINPERDIEAGAQAVHGITREFLQDKPVFNAIAKQFMDFVADSELIIHNAPFDIGFLDSELSKSKPAFKNVTSYCRIVDTLVLARQLHVGQRNSLDALCKRYSIDNSQREYHGALLDAHLLARVYLAMTGGQATLFGDSESDEKSASQSTSTISKTQHQHAITVINANEEEMLAHHERLEQMASKGKCLWLEQKTN